MKVEVSRQCVDGTLSEGEVEVVKDFMSERKKVQSKLFSFKHEKEERVQKN